MSNEKPLSERVRSMMFAFPHDDNRRNRVEKLADEIASMAQRLAGAESWRGQIDAFVRRIMGEVNCGKACGGLDWDQNNSQSTTQVVLEGIKAHTQAAIDAALIDLIHDLGGLYIHRNGHELYNSAIDDVARFIKGQLGTNPLAERAAEYARGIEFRAGQLAERDARIAELERELTEARKDAARLKGLRTLCGCVEDSSENTIKIFQDDATREWIIYVGKHRYYSTSFSGVIDAAMCQEGE